MKHDKYLDRKVLRVVEGDMFTIRANGKEILVRLGNVSALMDEHVSEQAKKILKGMIEGKRVSITTMARTKDDDRVAQVRTEDGEIVNYAMRQELLRIKQETAQADLVT